LALPGTSPVAEMIVSKPEDPKAVFLARRESNPSRKYYRAFAVWSGADVHSPSDH